MTTRQHVVLPTIGTCDLLTIPELEARAFDEHLSIDLPDVAPGWATARGAGGWVAAWFEGESQP